MVWKSTFIHIDRGKLATIDKLPSLSREVLNNQIYYTREARLIAGIILRTVAEAKGKTTTFQGEMERKQARAWLRNMCGSFRVYCDCSGIDFDYMYEVVWADLELFDAWCVVKNRRRYL